MERKFPFTIKQVAEIMDLTIRYVNTNTGNMDVDCFFCKRESKMNLDVRDKVYKCSQCGAGGGMIELYAKVYGVSNSEAYKEICELLGCSKTAIATEDSNPAPQTANRADNDTLHQTYSMLLSMLTLATPHKEQLLSRGLSQDQLDRYGYKSVPAFGQPGLCVNLLKSGCTLEGVPGFYKENGKWNVKLKAPGILIPVCGIDGKITGIQIRLNKPVNGRKYIWVSSNGLDSGASPGAPIHFLGDPTAKRVYVTTGSLKGTVAHTLTNHTFICLPGEKSLGGLDDLLLRLRENGVTEALEAFDMNKLTDKQTGDSAAKLREKLFSHGFKVTSAVWEDKSLSGVDDYFLQRTKARKNHVYDVDIAAAAV